MTSNQQRALFLAQAVIDGDTHPANLTDEDWALLLMAADINNVVASPMRIAYQVLCQFEHRMGYFRAQDGQWQCLNWQQATTSGCALRDARRFQ
jgi:hypothetical protein